MYLTRHAEHHSENKRCCLARPAKCYLELILQYKVILLSHHLASQTLNNDEKCRIKQETRSPVQWFEPTGGGSICLGALYTKPRIDALQTNCSLVEICIFMLLFATDYTLKNRVGLFLTDSNVWLNKMCERYLCGWWLVRKWERETYCDNGALSQKWRSCSLERAMLQKDSVGWHHRIGSWLVSWRSEIQEFVFVLF